MRGEGGGWQRKEGKGGEGKREKKEGWGRVREGEGSRWGGGRRKEVKNNNERKISSGSIYSA